jgi:electron transfer flavoprotein beta subunit
MKILVGIKHVPDTETKIKIGADGVAIDQAAVSKWVISPFDEYALEQALLFREAAGEGEVVLVCAGRQVAQQTLRQGLAMGADRAVLIQDERFDLADGLTRAKAVAAVAREEEPELALFGKYGVGTDEVQTGPMVAELLDWPHVSSVSKLELAGGRFTAEHGIEGAVEVLEGSLPAVITCEKGLNEPRYPSLKGIMQAKKKPITTKQPSDVGIEDAELGTEKMLVWESLELPTERGGGKLIDGDPEEAARELVRLLHEEAKVI